MHEMKIHGFRLTGLMLLLLAASAVVADTQWPRMVESIDGTPISYEVFGHGEPTLVFVHGWSCDARYWQQQVEYFAEAHRVVTVDLAGHGHSGQQRESYTMKAFGEDVKVVVEELDSESIILVGHSMGGAVIAQAARLIPGAVIGLIGVDTFQDVGSAPSEEEKEQWLAPLKADFRQGTSQFVASMFVPDTDAKLRDWIIADMAAAPPEVAISAMEEMLQDTISGESVRVFDGLEIPVVTINADLWPTNIDANRQHIESFDAIILEGVDHFLQMAIPETFNRELQQVIAGMMVPNDEGITAVR